MLTFKQFTRRIKSKYEDRWAHRTKSEVSGASSSRIKADPGTPRIKEEELAVPRSFTAVHGENKRRLNGKGKRNDQSDSEFDYDEEFQDDEEGAEGYMDDNALMGDAETKELAEKIKKDQQGGLGEIFDRSAAGAGEVEDDLFGEDSEEERKRLNKTGKEAIKLLKKHERREEYMDSDEELEVRFRY
jgi:hypothetical protein